MKKIVISGVAAFLMSWLMNTANAQFAYSALNVNNGAFFNNNIHSKAMQHFIKEYKNATDITWCRLNNGMLQVHFFVDGIQTKISYNKQGHAVSMIRYYTQDQLPQEVKRMVKSIYYDFNIFLVTEVTVGSKTACLVKIRNETCTKTLRVMNGEMDVLEEFENL